MGKRTIKDLDLRNQRTLVRVDYNVPMEEKDGRMVINDDTRIRETLPTLEALIAQGARIILVSHLGRPQGKREPSMSLRPVAARLADLLHCDVSFVDDCIGEKVERVVGAMLPSQVVLLENIRYHPGEEANDPAFAEKMARVAEAYVDDAFGAAHRAHASTVGVARVIAARGGPCVAGLLMERELRFLGDELEHPPRPFVVLLGGAKVSDKILVIERLIEKADTILIGGGMTYTFRLARGLRIGKSIVEPDKAGVAKAALDKAKARGVRFVMSCDNIVATPTDTGQRNKKGKPVMEMRNPRLNDGENIPDAEEGVDIGPKTIRLFSQIIREARTILWNGPMGLFEDPRFAAGTVAIAREVVAATQRGAKSIIGGGDSIKALNNAGLKDQVTFASTGGGASLEFLEGSVLPGVAVLADK